MRRSAVNLRILILALAALAAGFAPVAPAQQTLMAPNTTAGVVGRLTIGQAAKGALTGSEDDEDVPYHTYVVAVPIGTTRLVVKLKARVDLDIAIKHGSAIENYGVDDPDWDLVDQSLDGDSTLVVDDPTPGKWYVDIMNAMFETTPANYTLEIASKE